MGATVESIIAQYCRLELERLDGYLNGAHGVDDAFHKAAGEMAALRRILRLMGEKNYV
jgi:hypothetical protein